MIRLWPQGSLGLLAGIPWFYLYSHPQEPRGQKKALGVGPGLLQPLLPTAPESRGLSAWAGSEGYSSQREVVSSVCWVSLCQASPVRTRRPQIFQAPVSQDTWGGCCPGAPRPTKPQEIQKPWARQNQAAVSLNGWTVGSRAPAQLFLLPDPTSRVRTECDLQTRRAGAGGGRAQAQVRLGGPTGTGSLPLSHPWQRQQR